MIHLSKGANAPLNAAAVQAVVAFASGTADVSAYILGANGKVRSDDDMIFFNQPTGMKDAIRLDGCHFHIDLSRVDMDVEKIAICVVPEHGTVSSLGKITLEVPGVLAMGEETNGMTEAAIIVGEFYRRNGEWKFRSVAQGFNGGLAALSIHFGIEVEDAPATVPAQPIPAINLRKERLVSLEKKDPKLVSLAKTAAVSLEKKSLNNTTAKVALVLDISGSMTFRYKSGEVSRLVQRVLAMGLNMDDDGSIEVYAFGAGAYRIGVADVDNYKNFIPEMLKKRSLEGYTNYGKVINMIRSDYKSQAGFGKVPVYVMFVTDGDATDKDVAEREIKSASSEGIFWQFMGIGGSGVFSSGFDFLEKLDDLKGRTVDNCDFFSVKSADDPSDTQLFDKMMGEYPEWIKKAKAAGVLK